MLEKHLQKQILDYLAVKHIFHYRNNTGVMKSEYKGKASFVKFGAVGSPDIICVRFGKFIGIEVKGDKGKQSDSQKEFQKNLENAGGVYVLAYSLEDVMEFL